MSMERSLISPTHELYYVGFILGCLGCLGCSDLSWAVLGCSGLSRLFWATLGYSGVARFKKKDLLSGCPQEFRHCDHAR